MIRPSVLYPTLTKGKISGPIRCESIDGTELWLPARKGILNIPPFEKEVKDENGKLVVKTFGVSHIQRKSKYFKLLYDPFIFHQGIFWHLQETRFGDNGIELPMPGTERGIYWRTWGWRWQIPDDKSDWTPWIRSGGRIFGTHLD